MSAMPTRYSATGTAAIASSSVSSAAPWPGRTAKETPTSDDGPLTGPESTAQGGTVPRWPFAAPTYGRMALCPSRAKALDLYVIPVRMRWRL